MEAVGIDVLATAQKAGLRLGFEKIGANQSRAKEALEAKAKEEVAQHSLESLRWLSNSHRCYQGMKE